MSSGRAGATAGLVMAAVMLAGCGDDAPTASSTTPALANEDAAIAAALQVRADGCGPRIGFGTASLIDDALAVTAAHVVAGATGVVVLDSAGGEHDADVVWFDADLDVAVLSVPGDLGTPLPLLADPADAGDRGTVAITRRGNSGDAGTDEAIAVPVDVLRHVNISTTDIYLDDDVTRPGFEVDGAIDPGDSGAMVVIDGGGAGIVWARSNAQENRAWAVDLPAVLVDPARRAELTTVADVGPCIR